MFWASPIFRHAQLHCMHPSRSISTHGVSISCPTKYRHQCRPFRPQEDWPWQTLKWLGWPPACMSAFSFRMLGFNKVILCTVYKYNMIWYDIIYICADVTSYDKLAMLFASHKSNESWYHQYWSTSLCSEDYCSFVGCRSLWYSFHQQIKIEQCLPLTVNVSASIAMALIHFPRSRSTHSMSTYQELQMLIGTLRNLSMDEMMLPATHQQCDGCDRR